MSRNYVSFVTFTMSERSGSCAITIAIKMSTQPINSLVFNTWFNIRYPAKAANTDSKDNNIPAIVGLASFWAKICSVYATQEEKIPVYSNGI